MTSLRKTKAGWFLLLILSCLLYGFAADTQAQSPSSADTRIDPYAIGCILPMTGKHGTSGIKASEAMILALDLFDPRAKSAFKLIIEDAGDDPADVRAAVKRLAQEHKVTVIIGLISGAEAVEAAQQAQDMGVPIIILTPKERITDIGNYIFQYALTPQIQIQALIEYCMLDLGMKDFAILYPNDAYGREMIAFFRTEVQKHKGMIKKIRSYEKDQMDFGEEIKAITSLKQTTLRSKKTSQAMRPEEEDYHPSIDFDALFIPDTYGRVRMIASQLAFYNVRGIKLLGTNLWNHPDTDRKTNDELYASAADVSLEGAIFMDNFATNSYIPEAIEFSDLFFTAYNRNPGTLEAMAYDVVRISRTIILNYRVGSRDDFRKRLVSLRGYRGVTGKTSFADSQDADKSLFTLTIKDGQIIQTK